MLIEPASNVSVPFCVVTRTIFKTPPRVLTPDNENAYPSKGSHKFPEQVQIFPFKFVKTTEPEYVSDAVLTCAVTNPVVEVSALATLAVALPPTIALYPVASATPPVPSLISIMLEPFVLTTFNIIVIFFTQDGIPVKSMLVPDVDATAVP